MCPFVCLKPKDAVIRDWIIEEYIGTGEDRVQNRNRYTELIGDVFFNVAAVKTANAHRGNLKRCVLSHLLLLSHINNPRT